MVGDPENPVTVWHKLANQFEKKPLANKLKLHQKFNTMCLKEAYCKTRNTGIPDYHKINAEVGHLNNIWSDELLPPLMRECIYHNYVRKLVVLVLC